MNVHLRSVRFHLPLYWLTLILLTGCMTFRYADPPPPVVAPEPSGTLLNSELRIGVSPDYPPLAYKFNGQLVGMEVDFAKQLGKELGKQITFVESPWPELIPALIAGKIDIIMSGMSVTEERLKLVSFAESYMQIGQMALVRTKDQAIFANLENFFATTSRVGFVRNTTGEQVSKTIFTKANLTPQPTVEGGIAALRRGTIDVFIHDAPTVWRIGGNPGEKELTGLYWPLSEEPLAWAVRKNDVPLQFALTQKVKEWKVSGRLHRIMSQWIVMRVTTR